MTIRFAASQTRSQCRMPRGVARSLRFRPANDNRGKAVHSEHLKAALRHFAEHGLAAAEEARQQALTAARAGDQASFDWWLEICRALDRRMARAIECPAKAGG